MMTFLAASITKVVVLTTYAKIVTALGIVTSIGSFLAD